MKKLLGEGSYGCVFIPEITCTSEIEVLNKNISGRQTVGKVFTYYESKQSAVEKEKEVARLVNKWDPEARYFAIPNKICKTTLDQVKMHPEANKCSELMFFEKKELDQIVMPYYGLELGEYLKTYNKIYQRKFPAEIFIGIIKNILEGIYVLQQNKMVHMDIKYNNMLFDNVLLRLIDFSLLRSFKEVYGSEKFKERLAHSYFPYPLEFLWVYHYHYQKCKDCNIYTRYIEYLNTFGTTTYKSFLKFHSLSEIMSVVNNMEIWIKTTPNWFTEINTHVDKIDVYSFALVCIDVHDYLDFSNLDKLQKQNYIQFIKILSSIDCRTRPNAAQALDIYEQFFSS